MKFGAVLQACRERAGLTQLQMAAALNISQSCVSKFEKNKKEITLSLAFQWVKVTKSKEVLVTYLMGNEGIAIMATVMQLIGG